jgi:hypothetical protein
VTKDEQVSALAKAKLRLDRALGEANVELARRAKLLAVAADTITILEAAVRLKEDPNA